MRGRVSTGARPFEEPSTATTRPPLPRASLSQYQTRHTPVGLGVPARTSSLDLEDEETARIEPQRAQEFAPRAPSEPSVTVDLAPHKKKRVATPPPPAVSTIPRLPMASDPFESNLHRLEQGYIADVLSGGRRVSEAPRESWVSVRMAPRKEWVESPGAGVHRLPGMRRRSLIAKVLFALIAGGVLLLGAHELAVVRHVPWLDPAPAIARLAKSAAQHVPWDRLRKLPKLP